MTQPGISSKKVDGGRLKGAQAVRQCMEIQCKQTGANGKSANFTFHASYATTAPSSVTVANALFASIGAAWGTDLAPLMAPSAAFTAVWVRDMANVNNPIAVGSGPAIPGTGTLPALDPENCIVLTENVQKRGRGLKGRAYISGWVVAADAGNGVIAPAAVTAVENFGLAVFNALQAQSLVPCVAEVPRNAYTGLTGTQHPARQDAVPPVQNYTVRNNEWDSQRRRGLNG